MAAGDRTASGGEAPLDDLAAAAERLLDLAPEARAHALDDLIRARPERAAELRRLAQDLAAAERLLAAGYGEEPRADRPMRGEGGQDAAGAHAGDPRRVRRAARRLRVGHAVGAAAVAILATFAWTKLVRADAIDAAQRELASLGDVLRFPAGADARREVVARAGAVHRALAGVRPASAERRAARAGVLVRLAEVHRRAGAFPEAERIAREATVEAEALRALRWDAGCGVLLADALAELGRAQRCLGQLEGAQLAFDRAARELEPNPGAPPADVARLVTVLRERGSVAPDGPGTADAPAWRRALGAVETLVGTDGAARADLVAVRAGLAHALAVHGEGDEAKAHLARAEGIARRLPAAPPLLTGKLAAAAARVALLDGDRARALACLRAPLADGRADADEGADAWTWGGRAWLLAAVARHERALGAGEAAQRAARAAADAAGAAVDRFPASELCRAHFAEVLSDLAATLHASGRRSDLAEAERCARRALALLGELPQTVDLAVRARARWRFLLRLRLVLDATGAADAADEPSWEAVALALEGWRERHGVDDGCAGDFVTACLRIARDRLDDDVERAAAALDRAQAVLVQYGALLDDNHAPRLYVLRALVAARRGDDLRAADEARRAQGTRTDAAALLAASEALHAAWRSAEADSRARARAADHCERAITLHLAAIDALASADGDAGDAQRATLLAQARVRIAELLFARGDDVAARAQLERGLDVLERVRGEVFADWWDEGLYRRGKALGRR